MWVRGGVQGRKKTLVQSLKQYHAHFYLLYEKGMTSGVVSLQGWHSGNAFRHPNVSASVGLKSFCPWYLKLGGNTETITIHLWEVHYRMAIMYKICWEFACMSAQNILDHHSWCKVQCDKECAVHEGPWKPLSKRSLRDKRKHPSHMVQMLPKRHKEQNIALHLLSSQARNIVWSTPWIILSHPGLISLMFIHLYRVWFCM